MATFTSYSMNDHDGQRGTVGVHSVDLTAANFDAQVAAATALGAAIFNLSIGHFVDFKLTRSYPQGSPTENATDPSAQRGVKWFVGYHDNTANLGAGVPNPFFGKPFHVEIPCADLTLRSGQDEIYTPSMATPPAEATAFVTAFEAFAKSPAGGAAVVDVIAAATRSGG